MEMRRGGGEVSRQSAGADRCYGSVPAWFSGAPKRPRESRSGKTASSSSAWFRREERQGGRAASPCDWRRDRTRPEEGGARALGESRSIEGGLGEKRTGRHAEQTCWEAHVAKGRAGEGTYWSSARERRVGVLKVCREGERAEG